MSELADLRLSIVAEARGDEQLAVERLLGQLAAIEAQRSENRHGRTVEFVPPPTSANLAERAVERLRAGWRLARQRPPTVPRDRQPV